MEVLFLPPCTSVGVNVFEPANESAYLPSGERRNPAVQIYHAMTAWYGALRRDLNHYGACPDAADVLCEQFLILVHACPANKNYF